MKKVGLQQGKFLPLLVLGGFVLVAIALFVFKPQPKPQAPATPEPPALIAFIAEPKPQQVVVSTQGTVRPKREIDLVAEVAGRVVNVADNYVSGGFFGAADVLLEIDPQDYKTALIRAESQVADAQQALALERGQARLAKKEWQNLDNQDANDLFLRKPQIAAAQARLKAAEADLEQAKINLQRTKIQVPFAGRLRTADVNIGEYVSPGKVVGKAFSTDVMEVPLPLTNRQIGLVDLPLFSEPNPHGVVVEISASIGGNTETWQGEIVRTDASFDTQSRVVYAIAEVKGAYEKKTVSTPLAAGMFVRAQIQGNVFPDVIEVPRRAIYERDNVLTLDAENRLQITPVTVLQAGAKKTLIKGVPAGTVVLIEQPAYVVFGMKIKPVLEAEEQGRQEAQ